MALLGRVVTFKPVTLDYEDHSSSFQLGVPFSVRLNP